jgi:hypothetical protein
MEYLVSGGGRCGGDPEVSGFLVEFHTLTHFHHSMTWLGLHMLPF